VQLQICDILAGAAVEAVKAGPAENTDDYIKGDFHFNKAAITCG